jgi:hypothetical protein
LAQKCVKKPPLARLKGQNFEKLFLRGLKGSPNFQENLFPLALSKREMIVACPILAQ